MSLLSEPIFDKKKKNKNTYSGESEFWLSYPWKILFSFDFLPGFFHSHCLK